MPYRVWRPYPFTDKVGPGVLRELKRLGVRWEDRVHKGTDGMLVLLAHKVDAALLAQAPRCKVVANVAVGYDNLDVPACTRAGVVATNTPDVLTEATADCAWALLLATARRVAESDRYVRAGNFKRWDWERLRGLDFHGKTLGIVGGGRIGQATGRRALGFGMTVLYTARTRKPDFEKACGARRVSLRDLLRRSDFVSVHVPLSKDTRHLIGARELALMKPTAILVNTARGPVVDEKALVAALKKGRIWGAGLDVFEEEPRVHPGLVGLDSVVLLPHIGSATEETRARMVETAMWNLAAGLQGKRPPNPLNARELGLR
jgi:glyoxylate reductase